MHTLIQLIKKCPPLLAVIQWLLRTAEQIHQLGLSEVAVGALVSNTMQPKRAGTVEIDGTGLTVYLQAASVPATVDELKALPIPTAAGLIMSTFGCPWNPSSTRNQGISLSPPPGRASCGRQLRSSRRLRRSPCW